MSMFLTQNLEVAKSCAQHKAYLSLKDDNDIPGTDVGHGVFWPKHIKGNIPTALLR